MRGIIGTVIAVVFSLALLVPPAFAASADEGYLLGLINAKRTAREIGTLSEHEASLREARAHSEDMAARGEMGHFGFDDRVARIRAADSGIGFVCENVAYASGYGSDETALRAIFRGWRSSPPHRECMFDQDGYHTRSAAVGLAKSGSTWWATFITAQDSTA